jgi:DNA replication ATP-dependent helicase Dna2
MTAVGTTFYQTLFEIADGREQAPEALYLTLMDLLTQLCWEYTRNEGVQFRTQGLYGKILYLGNKYGLPARKIRALQGVRKLGNDIRSGSQKVDYERVREAGSEVLAFVQLLSGSPVPASLRQLFPPGDFRYQRGEMRFPEAIRPEMRVILKEIFWEEQLLACYWEELEKEDFLLVAFDTEDNRPFSESIKMFWVGAELQLVKVKVIEGIFYPQYIILDPDYLLDVSTLAECVGTKSTVPVVAFTRKFRLVPSNTAILLGNIVNYFLDQLTQALQSEGAEWPAFSTLFKRTFGLYPIEFTVNEDLRSNSSFRLFMEQARWHYENLRRTVEKLKEGEEAELLIEPSFLSPRYGMQGRLDLLRINPTKNAQQIIELKTSKRVPTFGAWNNHEAQGILYLNLIEKVFENRPGQSRPTSQKLSQILYSSVDQNQDTLRQVEAPRDRIQSLLDLRNQVAAREYQLASAQTLPEIEASFAALDPNRWRGILPGYQLSDLAEIHRFALARGPHLPQEAALFRSYFLYFANFIAQEWRIAKLGEGRPGQNRKGHASLWLTPKEEKKYEILENLSIMEGPSVDNGFKLLVLGKPEGSVIGSDIVNFRNGDAVVLYQSVFPDATIEHTQFFRGTITIKGKDRFLVELRHEQRNPHVFREQNGWNIEYDFFDSGYTSMFGNLYQFMASKQLDRQKRILGMQAPREGKAALYTAERDPELNPRHKHVEIIEEALGAPDYFLIMGPPGTGKTSIILKHLVRQLLQDQKKILLLAYTNRAVDEICDAIAGQDYLRIGRKASVRQEYHPHLLGERVKNLSKRGEVSHLLQRTPIFVATVAGMSRRFDLFDLCRFDLAIIDEASQILEPQIVGLLSMVPKFIMIGDHKQLPAVVLSPPAVTRIAEPGKLREIALRDRRNSLFERLYRLSQEKGWDHACAMLTHQGRMHPVIAKFPSQVFYGDQLQSAGREHQNQSLQLQGHETSPLSRALSQHRLLFFKSEAEKGKRHVKEAQLVARLIQEIQEIYQLSGKTFYPEKTLGVITPYRDQIATIRRELKEMNISGRDEISVDTVERYQGSQRDIIILSFSINHFSQLELMSDTEEEGVVDRKLNVALTRAREQLFIVGTEEILSQNLHYFSLLEYITAKGGYIGADLTEVRQDNFTPPLCLEEHTETEPGTHLTDPARNDLVVLRPSVEFLTAFAKNVLKPIKEDPRTDTFPARPWGVDGDFCRTVLIQFGLGSFDREIKNERLGLSFSARDQVNAYCYLQMRKHYFAARQYFSQAKAVFARDKPVIFLDIGCGPLSTAIAFQEVWQNEGFTNEVFFIGLDRSEAMRQKAAEFGKDEGLFPRQEPAICRSFAEVFSLIREKTAGEQHLIVLHYSHFFASPWLEPTLHAAEEILPLLSAHPQAEFLLTYQNSPKPAANVKYELFRRSLDAEQTVLKSGFDTVYYRNAPGGTPRQEAFFYQILALQKG